MYIEPALDMQKVYFQVLRTRLHGVSDHILAGFGAGSDAADVRMGQSQQVGGAVISWLGSLFIVWSWFGGWFCTYSYVEFLRSFGSIHLKSSNRINAWVQIYGVSTVCDFGWSNKAFSGEQTLRYNTVTLSGPRHPFIIFSIKSYAEECTDMKRWNLDF